MNKKELEEQIKKYISEDCTFELYLINNVVYFSLKGFDYREVCHIEIPYKNTAEKRDIYEAISGLVERFNFSFRVEFETVDDILEFI